MYNILLVCSAGMSTSLLVSKMEKAAVEQGIDAKVEAVAEADLKNRLEEVDVILLGPQVRYLLSKVKSLVESKNVPVEVVNSVDYGTMNGEKVLSHAISMVKNG